jgi:hypothetical protein
MTYTPYDENAITKQFHVARFYLKKIFVGDSTCCVLSGPEGIGKSRIVKQIAREHNQSLFESRPGSAGALVESFRDAGNRIMLMEEADFLWGSAPALNHAKIGFGAIGGIRMLGHKVRGVWAIPVFPVRCSTICTTNIEFDNPASFKPRVRADINAVLSRIDVVTFSFKALDLYSYSAALVTEQNMLRNLTKPSVKQQITLAQINSVLSFWHEFAGRHRDLSPRGIIHLAEDLLGTDPALWREVKMARLLPEPATRNLPSDLHRYQIEVPRRHVVVNEAVAEPQPEPVEQLAAEIEEMVEAGILEPHPEVEGAASEAQPEPPQAPRPSEEPEPAAPEEPVGDAITDAVERAKAAWEAALPNPYTSLEAETEGAYDPDIHSVRYRAWVELGFSHDRVRPVIAAHGFLSPGQKPQANGSLLAAENGNWLSCPDRAVLEGAFAGIPSADTAYPIMTVRSTDFRAWIAKNPAWLDGIMAGHAAWSGENRSVGIMQHLERERQPMALYHEIRPLLEPGERHHALRGVVYKVRRKSAVQEKPAPAPVWKWSVWYDGHDLAGEQPDEIAAMQVVWAILYQKLRRENPKAWPKPVARDDLLRAINDRCAASGERHWWCMYAPDGTYNEYEAADAPSNEDSQPPAAVEEDEPRAAPEPIADEAEPESDQLVLQVSET